MKNFNFTVFSSLLILLIIHPIQGQDWANLGRFKAENAKLKLTPDNENRVVFIGNSITEGWLKDSTSFFYSKPYINRGISGQTTPQMLIRFKADVINLNPKIVVILAGINDIAGNTGSSTIEMIVDNITSMSELSKAHGIKVIISSVLPAFDFPWKSGVNPAEKIAELNRRLKNYSGRNGILYLDYFTSMANNQNGLRSDLTYDGVHPNLTGYKLMEPLAAKAIENYIKQD